MHSSSLQAGLPLYGAVLSPGPGSIPGLSGHPLGLPRPRPLSSSALCLLCTPWQLALLVRGSRGEMVTSTSARHSPTEIQTAAFSATHLKRITFLWESVRTQDQAPSLAVLTSCCLFSFPRQPSFVPLHG